MEELLHIVETPRRCSYLPHEVASLEVRGVASMSGDEYADLLARGYRRFGWQVFRPACPDCRKCVSVRLLPQEFEPSGSERRVLRKNARIRAELRPLFMTREHIELYNVYHRFQHEHRGWPLQQTAPSAYRQEFLSGASGRGGNGCTSIATGWWGCR
jgi:arginine-tRNA-protein transferase